MITTVTLNPCIDQTLFLDGFSAGGLNIVERSRSDASGKGVNVSIVLRALGLSTMCTGISFDGNGSLLDARLEEQCIARDFAMAHGNIRTNIKVMDGKKGEMTELNSRGEPVADAVIREYFEKLLACAKKSCMLVFSGRIPNGANADINRRSLEAVAHLPVKTIIDAEKEPLKQAVLAKPYLIKPNLFELSETFGCKIDSRADAVRACRRSIADGVGVVCVSMGGEGAIIADENEAWFTPAMDIEVKGFQGAGDSMVAGICKAICEGLSIREMLAYGTAAASASLIREGTLLCRREDFNKLLPQVKTIKI